jgi:hypothetical protein
MEHALPDGAPLHLFESIYLDRLHEPSQFLIVVFWSVHDTVAKFM